MLNIHILFITLLVVSALSTNEKDWSNDACLVHQNCSACLRDHACGWLHGVQNLNSTKQQCTTYCVTKNSIGTGPKHSAFQKALAKSKSKDCVCLPKAQCGLWFSQLGGCPYCAAEKNCADCLSMKGCNMKATKPFQCAEYNFRSEETERTLNGTKEVNLDARLSWVGDDCGSLCTVQYSLTNCLKCVNRADLLETGVVCGWCGLSMFARGPDEIAECLASIDSKPYGDLNRCAHGNLSRWFTTADACEPRPTPFNLPFPYLSIAFPAIIVTIFLVLVIIFVLRHKQYQQPENTINSPLKSMLSMPKFYSRGPQYTYSE